MTSPRLTRVGADHPRVKQFINIKRNRGGAPAERGRPRRAVGAAQRARRRRRRSSACSFVRRCSASDGVRARRRERRRSRARAPTKSANACCAAWSTATDPMVVAALGIPAAPRARDTRASTPRPAVVVLDRMELAGNLGAIIRCADGAGAAAVVLTDRRDPGDAPTRRQGEHGHGLLDARHRRDRRRRRRVGTPPPCPDHRRRPSGDGRRTARRRLRRAGGARARQRALRAQRRRGAKRPTSSCRSPCSAPPTRSTSATPPRCSSTSRLGSRHVGGSDRPRTSIGPEVGRDRGGGRRRYWSATSSGERMPTRTVSTAGWPRANCIAAAGERHVVAGAHGLRCAAPGRGSAGDAGAVEERRVVGRIGEHAAVEHRGGDRRARRVCSHSGSSSSSRSGRAACTARRAARSRRRPRATMRASGAA